MTVSLTPTAVDIPASVAVPADGELVNSASVQGYVQPILNGIKYASNLVSLFVTGGVANIVGTLNLQSTGSLILNSVVIPQPGSPVLIGVDGVSSGGRVRAPKNVVNAQTVASTYFFDVATDLVFNSAGTSGVVWQLNDSAITPNPGECITFINHSTFPIQLNQVDGSGISNLKLVSGFLYGITMCFDPIGGSGATWQPVDYRITP